MADIQTLKGFNMNLFPSMKVYKELLKQGEVDENDFNLVEGDEPIVIDETLKMSEEGVLGVNTTTKANKDNTLPITSGGVYAEIGNIGALLETI